jgi:hypothetical protein
MKTENTINGYKVIYSAKPTKEDAKQNKLFKEAVKLAVKRQKLLGKPIARYDAATGKAYMEYPDGK